MHVDGAIVTPYRKINRTSPLPHRPYLSRTGIHLHSEKERQEQKERSPTQLDVHPCHTHPRPVLARYSWGSMTTSDGSIDLIHAPCRKRQRDKRTRYETPDEESTRRDTGDSAEWKKPHGSCHERRRQGTKETRFLLSLT